jgi:Double zinc ribbon
MVVCGNCGKDNLQGAKYCNSCAKELAPPGTVRLCISCGAQNAPEMIYCGQCGATLDSTKAVATGAPRKVVVEPKNAASGLPKRYCRHCGGEVDIWDTECPQCHQDPSYVSPASVPDDYDYSQTDYDYESSSSASGTLIGGAILAILAGVLALGQGILYATVSAAVYIPSGSLCLCGGLDMIFGLASILGGLMALKRTSFTLALLGAILGMLGFGFIVGALFGLIAVILIAVSRNDFD